MLKKGIDKLLFLTHKFLAFLEAVRLTFDVNDGAVVQDTVQDSGGKGDVGKDLVPLGEGLMGSENGGGLLIASGNQLENRDRINLSVLVFTNGIAAFFLQIRTRFAHQGKIAAHAAEFAVVGHGALKGFGLVGDQLDDC